MAKRKVPTKRRLPSKAEGLRKAANVAVPAQLLADLRLLIDRARQRVSSAVNSEMVQLYWMIGQRIRRDILNERRAEYGERIVEGLSRQLTTEFGKGYARRNLFRMIRFADVFPDNEIVSSLMTQLSWTHFLQIIPLESELERTFYAELCRVERWSVRTLQAKIQSMLFERTAISRKPNELIREELALLRESDRLTPDLVFRDPYLLDFLEMSDRFLEKDLEQAILRELEAFILEFGTDFCFVARQHRITVDHEDYYLDLLFYHRRLRTLVAIDLKLGRFKASDKGQMELYLRWLERHEQRPDEEPPIGLILCADKSVEHVELLRLDESNIRVAQYLSELPDRDTLARKLHEAITIARDRLAVQPPEAIAPPVMKPPKKRSQVTKHRKKM